jgi:energy-coupling factor transporter ATP-binding protein EcfA2
VGEPGSAADRSGLLLKRIEVQYPARADPALKDVSLSVGPGEIVSVAGRNGAGKSTLTLVAAGFIPRVVRARVAGQAIVEDRPLANLSDAELRQTVGIVFATPSNQLSGSKLSVREELAFGLENLAIERSAMDGIIDGVLARLGIEHLADREPLALSGGEQQRVAIASIVAMGTRLLVLDEPTAQLDPAGVAAVADLLLDLTRSGTGVLCAEHAVPILTAAGRCVVLSNGKVVADDAPAVALMQAANETGLRPPTLLALAAAADLPTIAALDEDRVAKAYSDPVVRAMAARRLAAADPKSAGTRHHIAFAADRPPVTIDVVGLRHAYPGSGVEALRGVDLRIEPGESIAVVGRNGSGKTTLVKHLNGLLRPSSGEVRIDGQGTAGRPIHELAATIGFVFQDPADQLFDRSVEREVGFGPRNLGLGASAIRDRVEAALAAVGLEHARATNPYDLGGSDRKLVALASVLAMDPAVLVLDEPTTGQDAPGIELIGAIVAAWSNAGRSVIAITHDMEFAAEHFGRVVVMREGEVGADGAPASIFSAANMDLLASTGLALPVTARVSAASGLARSYPTLRGFAAALSEPSHGTLDP